MIKGRSSSIIKRIHGRLSKIAKSVREIKKSRKKFKASDFQYEYGYENYEFEDDIDGYDIPANDWKPRP